LSAAPVVAGRPSVGVVLSGGEVLLGAEGVRLVRAALVALQRSLDRDGIGMPTTSRLLLAVLDQSAATAGVGSAAVPLVTDLAPSVLLDPVSSREVAEMLHCQPRNARDLCARGAFPSARQLDGRWLVKRSDVLERQAS
jgi:hypothetical protein